jgi:cytidylate kinase
VNPVIAIDGPAAAGKGTLARRIAQALGLPYLDTGLLYRAVARCVLDAAGDPRDPATATAAARALTPADLQRHDLRGPIADDAAASVAAIPGVRTALLDFQRNFGATAGAVLDGRDIGTVVCPEADAKLFLTATLAARAARRFKELQAGESGAIYERVLQDMKTRDARDSGRVTAPLTRAAAALELDTTALDADAAFAAAVDFIATRLAGRAH